MIEQLEKFATWEEENNPHPDGHEHIARWAVNFISRLSEVIACNCEPDDMDEEDKAIYDECYARWKAANDR